MSDVENLKKIIKPVAQLSTAIGGILDDGQVNLRDLSYLPSIFSAIRGFAGIDFKMVLPEVKDLSDDETKELATLFNLYFDLSSDSLEETIENGMGLILMALQSILALMNVAAKVKA